MYCTVQYCTVVIVVSYSYVLFSTIPGLGIGNFQPQNLAWKVSESFRNFPLESFHFWRKFPCYITLYCHIQYVYIGHESRVTSTSKYTLFVCFVCKAVLCLPHQQALIPLASRPTWPAPDWLVSRCFIDHEVPSCQCACRIRSVIICFLPVELCQFCFRFRWGWRVPSFYWWRSYATLSQGLD